MAEVLANTRDATPAETPHDAPSSSFSNPTTGIHSLPQELHLLILEKGAEYSHDSQYLSRYSFLRTASLVCQDWRTHAKRLLWADVSVKDESRGRKILMSDNWGQFRTRLLNISGEKPYATSSGIMAQALIHGARLGLKHLVLKDCVCTTPLSTDLSDLTTLTIKSCLIDATPSLSFPPLSTLRKLSLDHYISGSDSPYSCFTSPYLQHLSITNVHHLMENSVEDLAELLQSVGPQLVHLHLDEQPSESIADLVPLFSTFNNLKHLNIFCTGNELVSILYRLPSKLSHLNIEQPFKTFGISGLSDMRKYVEDISSILHFVKDGSLSKLLTLTFRRCCRGDIVVADGKPLVKALERRGIKVSYGVNDFYEYSDSSADEEEEEEEDTDRTDATSDEDEVTVALRNEDDEDGRGRGQRGDD